MRPLRMMSSTTARLLAPALVLLALTAGACSSDSDDAASTTTSDAGASTTAPSDDGGPVITESGPITLTVGGRATIELQANPTTGYQWELATEPDAAVVKVVSDEYTATPTDKGVVGSGGSQRMVIEGVAAGATTIDLRYVRPWESDQPPAETATFAVTVG